MEKEFSIIECQKIMNLLTGSHNKATTTMYQNYKWKNILIVEMVSVGAQDIKALDDMRISTTMFGTGNNVEVWMQKY